MNHLDPARVSSVTSINPRERVGILLGCSINTLVVNANRVEPSSFLTKTTGEAQLMV